jgi:acyl-CoA synthetase (NDP forming)
MRLLGPDSLGVLNHAPDVGLRAVGVERVPPRGALAVASEAPARGAELLARLVAERIGVSTFVSLGRRADVSANDCLAFWLEDGDTRAIALDVSSVGNPLKFARLAARVAARKPITAVATGDAAQDALLAGAGVEIAPTLEALLAGARRRQDARG